MQPASSRPAVTFLGIAGSLRRLSYNRGLVRAAVELAPQGITVIPFDIAEIPFYNADVEAQGDPEPVVRFKRAIAGVDGLLIASPEYNHCVPGVLKNAIDWASRPPRDSVLTGKPIAIMGASTSRGGTARAQAQLRDGLSYTGGLVLPLPEVLVPRAFERFDAESNLTDEEVRENVRDLLLSFRAWTSRVQSSADMAAEAS